MKKLIYISCLFMLYGCIFTYDHVESIQVINYSDEGQVICYTCSDSIGSMIDNLTINRQFKQFDDRKSLILSGDLHIDKKSFKWHKIHGKKESIVSGCEDRLVRFFFISDSVFLNHTWDTIVRYQMYNKKLVFSEEDLTNMDWVIEYK